MAADSPHALARTEAEALATTHRLKLKPPTYNGDYATFEEWKYKFNAYMGLIDATYPALLERAESATTRLTDMDLTVAANTTTEGDKWIQLASDLRYILISITTGPVATVCRQHQHEMGLEIFRQLCNRFSIPLGTRSIGYLTKLLKPTFDNKNFEESFATWEFELTKFERDNGSTLPEAVKIAVFLNETTGPLQQHLQLLAGTTPTYAEVRTTIMEYYRSITAFNRLQQPASSSVGTNFGGGPAPMDVGGINKGKGKGYKGKGYNNKGKGKYNKGYGKGKGYGGYNNKGKGKGYSKGTTPVGYGNPYGGKGQRNTYGKGKKVRMQPTYATNAATLDTMQETAAFPSTTLATQQRRNNTTRQQFGTMTNRHMMQRGGTKTYNTKANTSS